MDHIATPAAEPAVRIERKLRSPGFAPSGVSALFTDS